MGSAWRIDLRPTFSTNGTFFQVILIIYLTLTHVGCDSTAPPWQNKNWSVVVFMGAECPISQNYASILAGIKDSVNTDELEFHAIFPVEGITTNEMATFQSQFGFNWTSHIDHKYRLSERLDATVTPEVFVLNPQGRIIYQGAIDDRYLRLGEKRTNPTRHYLKEVIQTIESGREPEPFQTEAIGCIIER